VVEQANQKNNPPLPDNELKNTFYSIVEREKRNNNDRWYKKEESKTSSKMWDDEDNKILPMNKIASMEEYLA